MRMHTVSAIVAGFVAASLSIRCAIGSLGCGSTSGALLLSILTMWAVGIATTAFGASAIAFYGVGLAELRWRDRRRRKDVQDLR
ncbi:hypothetical protein [Belnapia rosea]|uniref:hypothetical protein n=1 Tax=Belnapia rosea TaxID=938405 RepID=UPI0015A0176F|nr:hypothetical protein [Belnapia rosea]